MNTKLSTVIISLVIIILALALLDPFMVLLPGSLAMTIILMLAVSFIAYMIFAHNEKARDEREVENRMAAARVAWFSGGGVVLLGIVYQGLIDHSIDAWLIYSLVAMVLGKLLARWYWDAKN